MDEKVQKMFFYRLYLNKQTAQREHSMKHQMIQHFRMRVDEIYTPMLAILAINIYRCLFILLMTEIYILKKSDEVRYTSGSNIDINFVFFCLLFLAHGDCPYEMECLFCFKKTEKTAGLQYKTLILFITQFYLMKLMKKITSVVFELLFVN